MAWGAIRADVMVDTMFGAFQRESRSDQCGSIPEELDELILTGLDFGNAADVGRDSPDDAIDDGEAVKADESAVAEIDE